MTQREHGGGGGLISEALAERLFEFSPDAIIATDQSGRIAETNARAEELFGYSRAELLGQPVEILIPDRFRSSHPARRDQYNAHPRRRSMGLGLELYGRHKNGTEFPVDIMLGPVDTPDGVMALSVIRDISEQKRLQETLLRTEAQFHSIIDSISDYAIYMLDRAGNVSTWSPGAERIKGYTAEEIKGEHFSRFFVQEDVDSGKPQRVLQQASSQGQYQEEGWRVRKDGSRFWASVVITAMRDQGGQLTGFSKVTRDFTNRKTAEEALLLQMSKVLLSTPNIQPLLSAISAGIQQVAPHDLAMLSVYDPVTHEMRVQQLQASEASKALPHEFRLPVEGSVAGWVFSMRQPLNLSPLNSTRFPAEAMKSLIGQGFKSICAVPLLGPDHAIGALAIISSQEAAFTEKETEMLSQIARQVTPAISSVLAYQQTLALSDKLRQEKQYLEEELNTEHSFTEIIGETASLKRQLKQVETVAPTGATVLVLGETGTGKELIARAIHRLSPRRERTFVKLNCASIPSGLLESELFGHEKGAFTGAIAQKLGRLELAHQGTLFLDEVGEIPLELQPKLLRALQENEFERLGGNRTIHVDFRLIAATNRDLGQMVADGRFRSDLYYRLKVFPIELPPLRERPGDIPLLVSYFVDKHARRMGKSIESIPPEAMAAFNRWRWPGNIRELENFLERAVILSSGSVLRAPLGELEIAEAPEPESHDTLEAAERAHILQVLRETKGMVGGPDGAAARLGLKRTTLNSKLKKLGISPRDDI